MKIRIYTYSFIFLALIFSSCSKNNNSIKDWNQFRGPDRDGKSTETGLLKSWPENGPEQLWLVDGIGDGHSTVAIKDDRLFITGMIDTLDYLTAYTIDGKKLWQVEYGNGWKGSYPGVRITPTIDEDKIYVISGMGEISRIDISSGNIEWQVNAFDNFEGEYGIWGIAENLLIVDDKVIYTPGGSKTTMIALDKNNGNTLWESKSLNDKTAYVSPILIEKNSKKIIINITANYILGVNAGDGNIEFSEKYSDIDKPLWHPRAPIINCTMPIYKNNQLFVTSGYNHTGVMFNINETANEISIEWQDSTLDNHHGGVIEVNGYLYGSNWINNQRGNWVCQDWKTGEVKYETKWENKGSILYADGLLYCYDERRGNIALVKVTPEEFKVISSFKINHGEGPHWAYPVIYEGKLFIRHGKTLAAYNIKG